MNYTHIEEKPKPVEKDFLVEIAKGIDILQNCGLKNPIIKMDIILSDTEFYLAFNHFSAKVITNTGRPKSDFKVNFSGVEVKFIKS